MEEKLQLAKETDWTNRFSKAHSDWTVDAFLAQAKGRRGAMQCRSLAQSDQQPQADAASAEARQRPKGFLYITQLVSNISVEQCLGILEKEGE